MDMNMRNVRIGIFAIGAFVILCLGVNYLKGRDLFFSGTKYYVCYPSITGLNDACPVIYNGYKIGSVRDIELNADAIGTDRLFVVTLAVEEDIPIPQNSKAELFSTDILGGKGIEIIFSDSPAAASHGDTLVTSIRQGLSEKLAPIKDRTEDLINNIDSALQNLNALIGGQNGQRLEKAIASLSETMQNMEAATQNIARLTQQNGHLSRAIASADTVMTCIGQNKQNIDTTLANLAAISTQLNGQTVATLNETLQQLNSITASIDSAKGTIGLLVNDSQLYDNLTKTTESINSLLGDIKENPSRYINISVFGGNKKK